MSDWPFLWPHLLRLCVHEQQQSVESWSENTVAGLGSIFPQEAGDLKKKKRQEIIWKWLICHDAISTCLPLLRHSVPEPQKSGTVWCFLVSQLDSTNYYKHLRDLSCLSSEPRGYRGEKGITSIHGKLPKNLSETPRSSVQPLPYPSLSFALLSVAIRVVEASGHRLWSLRELFLSSLAIPLS